MKALTLAVKIVAPLLVVALGVFGMVSLVRSKPEARQKPARESAPLVEVQPLEGGDTPVRVRGMGTVMPARSVTVQPQVSGRLVEVHPALVPGGVVRAGEPLARVEDADYALALAQQEAQVSRALLDLRVEMGRKAVAKREWAAIEGSLDDGVESDKDLALRDPQIRAARAAVRAARSAVSQAKLNLERTTVIAPFNAVVRTEAAEIGQVVGPQTALASLVGTDAFWVEVALPVDRLAWVDIPGVNAAEGARARVVQDAGPGVQVVREGRVVRLLGELEPRGRLARLLVEVDDPLGLEAPPSDRSLPLLIGAYVAVELDGRTLEDAVAVPPVAMREADRVWVVDAEGRLDVRTVDVAWREAERVLVTGGLAPGERVVTSGLSAPVPGMMVRVAGEATAATAPAAPAAPAAAPEPAAEGAEGAR